MSIQRSTRKSALRCGQLAILWATITLGGCGGGNAPPSPGAVTAVTASSIEAGAPTAAFVPVTGVNGTPPYTFSVSPALPAGLSLNSGTGALSGTPASAQAAITYAVTVSDTNSLTATADFSLAITPGVTVTTAVAATTALAYTVTTPFTPVTASNGTAPYTYSVSPALPTGLTLSATTGAVSGTTTVTLAQTVYTVKVTDAKSSSASSTFELTVNLPPYTALGVNQSVPATTVVSGPAITPFTPVTATGGFGSLSYAVSPALPTGLSMNSATGTISGSATVIYSPQTIYTVSVTDVLLTTRSATFDLTVNPGPLAATTAVANVPVTPGAALTPVVPVTVGGGYPPYTFAIAPGIIIPGSTSPATVAPVLGDTGLSFDTGSGTLSGAAATIQGSAPYTVTVTDSNGDTSSSTFQLTSLPSGYVHTVLTNITNTQTGVAQAVIATETLTWMQASLTTYTAASAAPVCAGTINGTTGWRLPTDGELLALASAMEAAANLTASPPATSAAGYLKAMAWPGSSAYYWSSNTNGAATYRVNLSAAIPVSPALPTANQSSTSSGAYYVTCVLAQ